MGARNDEFGILLHEPERRLLLEVLKDAVKCFRKYRRASGARQRRLFRDAEAWFTNDGEDYPFTFAAVCEALQMDAAYVRRGLCDLLDTSHKPRQKDQCVIEQPPALDPAIACERCHWRERKKHRQKHNMGYATPPIICTTCNAYFVQLLAKGEVVSEQGFVREFPYQGPKPRRAT